MGYVGTIGVIHDMDTVIRAAKLLEDDPDIGIVLVGEGSQSNQLRRIIQDLSPNNVYWLGNRPHDCIPAYLSQLDVGLNPVNDTPVFESILTVKFFEYLACGRTCNQLCEGYYPRGWGCQSGGPDRRARQSGSPGGGHPAIKHDASPAARACQPMPDPLLRNTSDRKMWARRLAEALEENQTASDLNPDSEARTTPSPTNTMYKW